MRTGSLRNFALTAHVAVSVGWLGAVAAFLALAAIGVSSPKAGVVRATYVAMEQIGWIVIVPCAFAALLTGLIQSLGTEWGLVRHYWVVVKLILTVGATAMLLLHMRAVTQMASIASATTLSSSDSRALRVQLILDAALAVALLLVITALSVYKPWGMTRYGRRPSTARTPWGLYVAVGIVGIGLLIIIVHLAGGGLGRH